MARLNLKSKEVRSRLKVSNTPYWMEIDQGLHIGYRKNIGDPVWCVRARSNGRYIKRTLGDADDTRSADGEVVLDFTQARHAAEKLFKDAQGIDAPVVNRGGYTVADAMTDYLDWFKLYRKTYDHTQKLCNRHIVSKLGEIPVNNLRTPDIERWVRNIAKNPPSTSSRTA